MSNWFADAEADYNDFIRALLADNVKEINAYMNRIALTTFSYFDTGKKPSEVTEPECLIEKDHIRKYGFAFEGKKF